MAYEKLYTVIGFENRPSRKALLSAENLNKMDSAINALDDRIVEMSGKADMDASDIALNRQTLGYVKKNLLKNTAVTKTVNGVTFTVHENKSITVKGTATADAYFATGNEIAFKPTVGKKYIRSGASYISAGSLQAYFSNINGDSGWNYSNVEFESITDNEIKYNIYVKKGYTVNDLTFYPMIRSADITDGTYESYVDDVDTRLKKLTPVNNLLTTVVGFPLDATMGKKLYDMMTWKFVGQESGNTVITLPDDWTELKIVLALNEGTGTKIPVEIIREIVNISNNKIFLVGGGSGNSAGTSLVRGRISVSETEAKIVIIYSGTMESPVDILSTTYIYVWYR